MRDHDDHDQFQIKFFRCLNVQIAMIKECNDDDLLQIKFLTSPYV
jgi:hypothetical protein